MNKFLVLLCESLMFFSVVCLLCLCAPLFICALWSPAGMSLLSFVILCSVGHRVLHRISSHNYNIIIKY